MFENWSVGNQLSHLLDCTVMKVGPEPFYVREREFPKGLTYISETWEELAQVICKSNEPAYIGHISWGWHLQDSPYQDGSALKLLYTAVSLCLVQLNTLLTALLYPRAQISIAIY